MLIPLEGGDYFKYFRLRGGGGVFKGGDSGSREWFISTEDANELLTVFTNVAITAISFNWKYNES